MSLFDTDDVHPSDAGHDAIAAMLLAALTSSAGGAEFTVEIALDGSTWQTEPDDIAWTDVTAYVLTSPTISIQRGASSARGQVDVGTCSFTLLNTDRRFDPTHTTGPYYGFLKPGVPVRVRVYPSGMDALPLFRGTISTWPQRPHVANRFACVPVQAYDGFDKLSRAKIPRAVYPTEVALDSPAAYWRLDETSGTVMLDSSGNGHDGQYDNADLGEDPLIFDGSGKSMFVDHVGDHRGQFIGEGLPIAAPVSIEAWVKFPREATQTHMIVMCQRDTALGSGLALYVDTAAAGSPNGELVIDFGGLGGFYKARGDTRVDDDETHHVVMTMASTAAADIKLYVDGVLQTKTVVSGTTGGTWTSHLWWVVGNVAASAAFDYGLGGYIDEAAVYSTALSAARVLAHYEAGATARAGERSDERIGFILDELDWPVDLRDLEEGASLLGAAEFKAGDNALEYLRLVNDTEDGKLFITPDGMLRFLDRYWRYLDTLATTPQFTFSDTSDTSYAEFDLDLDDELLVNVARLTRRGGAEQVAINQTSADTYGEAEVQKSELLHQTDAETRAQAEWIVLTQSTPLPRVPKIRVPLHRYSAADQASVAGLDMGHRVSVVRTPLVGDPIELDLVIDGVRHQMTSKEWWWEAYVSPVPEETATLFVLDLSELDGVDVLAY